MQKLDLTIRRGETVNLPIRIESATLAYRAITAITKAGPVRITSAGHGLADGWRAAVANAGGMSQINFSRSDEGKPPKDKDLRPITKIDADNVEFNDINSAGFSTYTSGGQIVFYAPLDLSAYTSARMQVKDEVDGTVLATYWTGDGTLEIDATEHAVWLRIADEDSALIEFDEGVFDLELLTAGGDVKAVCDATSTLTVLPEITTGEPA